MAKAAKMDKGQQKETLVKVLKYMKPYRFWLIAAIIMAAVSVVFTLYLPILTGDAVDVLLHFLPSFRETVDSNFDWWYILRQLLVKMGVVILLTAAAQWIMSLCNNHIVYSIIEDIREKAFDKIQKVPLKYLDGHSHGDIMSRVVADVDTFADGLLLGFTQLFTGVITILGTLLFMLSENVGITAVVVLITPVSLFVASFIAKKTFRMFQLQSTTRGEQTSLINEMITNHKEVKAFGREAAVMEDFDEINGRLEKCSLRAIFFSSLTNPCTRFVNSLVYMGVGLTGSLAVIRGGLTVGQLTCFLSYANQYTKPFNEISGVITELQNALACAARIFELIEEEPQIPDAEDARVLTDVDGAVSLNKVSFSYSRDRKLIEDLNLDVKPGQRIAIVGPTGCGKTTIINLLMRFYDVNKGKIMVEGTDIRDITRESLRTSYGMVLQDTWLRSGTIRDNITMGREGFSDEQIIAAAKEAHSYSFIKKMPKGLDTYITEDGAGMSQGQKQLLCITRVMLDLPSMLILDEATSSIDTRTEKLVQDGMDKLMHGRTTFVIAHRLSTVRNSDCIMVLEQGRIIERGTHDELIEEKGRYYQLYTGNAISA